MSELVSPSANAAEICWMARSDDGAVADFIGSVIAQKGERVMAVPGGKTPLPIFADLCRRSLPWGTVRMMLTDDRQVPVGHAASNQGKLEAAFNATAARIEPLVQGQTPPPFDLVWLGMGADGHIASLFPDMHTEEAEGLEEGAKAPQVIATTPIPLPPEAPFARLSLNMAALTRAKAIMLVIRGAEKKRVLEEAIMGANDLPIAQLIGAARCPIRVFWKT